MNEFVIGSLATGAVGIIGFAITSRSKPTRKFYALTTSTEVILTIIAKLEKPCTPDLFSPKLPLSDVLSVYFNSRNDRNWMNERRLDEKDNRCCLLLQRLDTNHSYTKRLAVAWVAVRILDKLAPDCHTTYCRNLLWSYAEGRQVLGQLGEYCSIEDRNFIKSRV